MLKDMRVAHYNGELTVFEWMLRTPPADWVVLPELQRRRAYIRVCSEGCDAIDFQRPVVEQPSGTPAISTLAGLAQQLSSTASPLTPSPPSPIPMVPCAYEELDFMCASYPGPMISLAGRFCVPRMHDSILHSVWSLLDLEGDWNGTWSAFVVGSVGQAVQLLVEQWLLVSVACALTVLLSVLFLVSTHFLAKPMLALAVLILPTFFASFGGGIVYWLVTSAEGSVTVALLSLLALICFGAALVIGSVLFGIRRRVKEATAIIKASLKPFVDSVDIMLLPVVSLGADIGLLVYVLVWVLWLLGSHPPRKQLVVALVLTTLLTCWCLTFLRAFRHILVSQMVARWYFQPYNQKGRKVLPCVACRATKSSLYHVGSAALGSLMVLLTKAVRLLFNFISRRVTQLKRKARPGRATSSGRSSRRCGACLACMEKGLVLMSSHAYVQVALLSDPFLKSSANAIK
ncbi:MAG: uncharacterized protein KVP18_003286 [Porospora cf. gigantea A]|uniref:uncharacterized protein n=1 Tax=Porospora cf. gigantea A TaxID=2853593 RepID=UPI00355A0F2B|nr:MAG: hypothetical protein KVP18_003286 [Porospora cf. gigantea A]